MNDRRPVTLADVARAAGVAKSTASYAFSDPGRLAPGTSQRVLETAARMGYAGPSALGRALASGHTSVVAVVTRALLESPDTDPFALQLIDGLSRELAQLGYGVLLLPPITDDATRALHRGAIYDAAVTVRRIDGIEETDAILAQRGVPLVRMDGAPDEDKAVSIDDAAPTRALLQELKRLGHERIASVSLRLSRELTPRRLIAGAEAEDVIAHLDERVEQRAALRRLEAFATEGVAPTHIADCPIVTREEAHAAALEMLSLPAGERPTAVVCQADVYAWGVWDAAMELGLRVPEDLSITGFDGLTGGVFDQLNLTTIVQDGALKGRLVASWVVRAAETGENPPPSELGLELRWGATTGPAPRA